MEVALFVISIIVGILLGYTIGRLSKKPKQQSIGTLQLDHSDPDMPYLFLLDCDLDYIATKKQVMFDVKVENIISHE